jgi:hypothetical protein
VTRHGDPLDLVLVGCGLRGTGLVTAVPQLLTARTAIVEASESLGPGSFSHYRIESNSSGSDFFGWIDRAGPFGDVLEHPDVSGLRTIPGNFRLAKLAQALRIVGAAIERRVSSEHLLLRERVVRVETDGGRFTSTLSSGRQLSSRAIVMAAGIRETPNAALAPWRHKVMLSSEIVRAHDHRLLDDDPPTPVAIVGGSHSGYSVAMRFHEALAAVPNRRCEVTLIHRSPVKLFYASWDEYQAHAHPALEAVPDPARDLCPETGNVFRYSGLRHGAKALFRAAAAGDVPWLNQVRVPALAEAAGWLERAAVVVQATGYESNTMPLYQAGRPLWTGEDRLVVQPGGDGCIASPGGGLFIMGMDPYPYRDNSLTPTGQYALRGKQILNALQA